MAKSKLYILIISFHTTRMGVRKKGRRQSDPSREEAESTDEENIQEVGFFLQ